MLIPRGCMTPSGNLGSTAESSVCLPITLQRMQEGQVFTGVCLLTDVGSPNSEALTRVGGGHGRGPLQ